MGWTTLPIIISGQSKERCKGGGRQVPFLKTCSFFSFETYARCERTDIIERFWCCLRPYNKIQHNLRSIQLEEYTCNMASSITKLLILLSCCKLQLQKLYYRCISWNHLHLKLFKKINLYSNKYTCFAKIILPQ